ncbi:MAG TPA: OmpA family protein, partial [Prevotella sp.]
MTRNIIKNYLLASLALCPLFAFAAKGSGPHFHIQKAYRDGDTVRAKMTVVLDDVKLKKQTLLMLTPTLTADNGEKSYAFNPIYVGRHNALVQYQRQAKKLNGGAKPLAVVHRKNGKPQQVEVMLSAPYSNWMADAAVKVSEKTRGCAGCALNEDNYNVAQNFFGEPYTPHYRLAYIEPKAEVNKVRNEKFAAHFAFIVSNSTLMRDYRNNTMELDRVDSITNSILSNKDLKVSDVAIDGYASPEGYEKANLDLSTNRAQALVTYLIKKYNLPAGMFHVQGHGEDWNGLLQQVTTSEMEWKKDVLTIIKNYSGQARKEKLVAVHEGLPYRFLLLNFYPLLRRTEYTLQYSVKDFSLEEAKAYMITKPHLLSLNEMYMV